jgi:hypothetical protein
MLIIQIYFSLIVLEAISLLKIYSTPSWNQTVLSNERKFQGNNDLPLTGFCTHP